MFFDLQFKYICINYYNYQSHKICIKNKFIIILGHLNNFQRNKKKYFGFDNGIVLSKGCYFKLLFLFFDIMLQKMEIYCHLLFRA